MQTNSALLQAIVVLNLTVGTLAQNARSEGTLHNATNRDATFPQDVGGTAMHIVSDAYTRVLKVQNVRLEAAPQIEDAPSVNLRFDLVNSGSSSVRDIIVEISVVEASRGPNLAGLQPVIAGPFRIRGKIVLEPGGTMRYEMRLRNLSPDCGCRVVVAVTSARAVGGPGS